MSFRLLRDAAKIIQENHYYPFGQNMVGIEEKDQQSTSAQEEQKFQYNAKEKLDEFGLFWNDHGARNLDLQTGRWTSIDPLAEKFASHSTYNYCLGNPIRFIDPDKIYEEYKVQLNQNLSYLNTALKSEGLSDGMRDALAKLVGSYKSTLKELSALEKSDQVYTIFYGEGKEGGVNYDSKSGEVKIGIGKERSSIGLIGHELKHAYQFEKGKISIVANDTDYGELYDITDETESYNRKRLLDSGIQYFTDPKMKWNDSDVKNFGSTMTPAAYQTLPSGPIDINSKEGKALRERTINAGRTGQPVQEVYKGWQKDYAKGKK